MELLYREERLQLLSAIREMRAGGLLDDSGGALSLRCGGHILVTPTGAPFRRWRVAEEDFVVLDGAGEVVQRGEYLGPSGTLLHLEIYRLFPEARAAAHSHAPYSLAFASLGLSVPATTCAMDVLGEVPCFKADDAAVKRDYRARPVDVPMPGGMVPKPEVALINHQYLPQLRDALLPRREELRRHGLAFTLYRHGVMTFARSLGEAVENLGRVESSARTYIFGQLITHRSPSGPAPAAEEHSR
jgi:ribulose-5-phosphate 4-epimerase/fuculose-1-phosphate aldolase